MAAALLAIRPILTVADICDLLRCSQTHFYELREELEKLGLLVPVYPELDRVRRYKGEPFVEWLSDKRQSALLQRALARITA